MYPGRKRKAGIHSQASNVCVNDHFYAKIRGKYRAEMPNLKVVKMEQLGTDITREVAVWTKDGLYLGNAIRLHHRQHEVNPELKYYAAYLETFSFETGERYYMPTDFIKMSAVENGRLTLTITLAQVEHNTWNREPAFVASGQAWTEEVPSGQA
jgi:hypothetical protein